MSEELSSEELDSLLGDNGNDLMTEENASSDAGTVDALKELLSESLSEFKQSLSQVLGEEVELSITTDLATGVGMTGAEDYYVASGAFQKQRESESFILVVPSDVSRQMATQYSGIEDIANNIEQVGGPITEIMSQFMSVFASSLRQGFKSNLDEFELLSDPYQKDADTAFIKISFSLGESSFVLFVENSILQTLNGALQEDDAIKETTPKETNTAQSSFLGSFGADSDDSNSLGDALLGENTVSDVSMPSFDDYSEGDSVSSNSIKMLMDVALDVTVELGRTKRLVGDILDLNRGSIIELKKLAGEPMDIKVNNKLIARGEVVVIDEYFGVRVIEIVSPFEKPKLKD